MAGCIGFPDLHPKHGPLVRVGPNHISASSPEALRIIHVEKLRISPMYGILQPQLDGAILHNLFSTQDVGYHTMHKRAIGGLYTIPALKYTQVKIARCTALFPQRLKEFTRFQPAVINMSATILLVRFSYRSNLFQADWIPRDRLRCARHL
ncbi:cytochrome P450 oxidoreductase protein [Rutstroemia sp. NJR-2017a BBW]|nr:cytochrome P450 oxidoreductase protein [Rutstroemia sp. NJR-2017a BBW]